MVTVAIFGHTGLLGKPLTAAFARTDATVKILHRAGSDVSQLPAGFEAVEIDYDDQEGLTKALTGVDIVVSLLGGPAIHVQKNIIAPAKAAGVKLFVPSEFGTAWTHEEGAGIPVIEAKHDVEDELIKSNLPYVKLNSGAFAESFLGKPFFGFVGPNKFNVSGETLDKPMVLSSLEYTAAATAAILTNIPPSELAGRTIGFQEVKVTTGEILEALEAKYGRAPEITYTPVDKLKEDFKTSTDPLHRLIIGGKLNWAAGTTDAGNELWDGEIKGYQKKSLAELLQKYM